MTTDRAPNQHASNRNRPTDDPLTHGVTEGVVTQQIRAGKQIRT